MNKELEHELGRNRQTHVYLCLVLIGNDQFVQRFYQIIVYVLLQFQQYVSGILENGVPGSTSLTPPSGVPLTSLRQILPITKSCIE